MEEGFESKSFTDTRATTDKNDPFLNMGFKHIFGAKATVLFYILQGEEMQHEKCYAR